MPVFLRPLSSLARYAAPDVSAGERVWKWQISEWSLVVAGHVRAWGGNGAYSVCVCERRTKFRAATSPTHQGLFILQRPLVGAVPCHGSAGGAAAAAACVSLRPARLDSRSASWETPAPIPLWLSLFLLRHFNSFVWLGCQCGRVLGGNSVCRVRPPYSKFLHFIVSSPR